MEKPQAALGGLTPQQAVIEWRDIPRQVAQLQKLQWVILGAVSTVGAVWGWQLFAPVPPHAALTVVWRWLGGA